MSNRTVMAGVRSLLIAVAAAVVMAAAAVMVKVVIQLTLGVNAGWVVYIPAIALAAWFRGLLSGLIVTGLGAVADILLFLPPLGVAAVEVREDQVGLGGFLFAGATVSFLGQRLRSARDSARRDAAQRGRLLDAEAGTRRLLDEMIESQRRASELREAFNSIMSHELRTPITSIYAGAKLLARQDRVLEEETRRELAHDLEQEAERLFRLVEDLLILARTERGSIELGDEPVLLPHVADRVVRSEQARWPTARFEIRTEGIVSAARGDDTYIEQVLRNLLGNAAKYSPAGARIEVVVDETPDGSRVRVLDEGAGIDADEAGRLFDLYYRSPSTATSAGGAGIGLFVCRTLIEAMGGRMWAAPRPEVGSEFGFTLPLYEEDGARDAALRRAARVEPDAQDQERAAGRPPAAGPHDRQSP